MRRAPEHEHQVSRRATARGFTPCLVLSVCTGVFGCARDAESEAIRCWVRNYEPTIVWIRDVFNKGGDVPYPEVETPEGVWESPKLLPVLLEESGSQDHLVRGFVYFILSRFLTYHDRPLTAEEEDIVVRLCSKGMHDTDAGCKAKVLMDEDAIHDPQVFVVSGVSRQGLWLARRVKKDLIHVIETAEKDLARRIAMGIIEDKLGPEAREALPAIRGELLSDNYSNVHAAQCAFMAITGAKLVPDPAVEGRSPKKR